MALGGRWTVDRLASFVSFDREAWNAAIAGSLRRRGIPSDYGNCVISRLKRLADDEVQDTYLSFDKEQLDQIVITCAEEARRRSAS